jgi:hypothetical protein
MFPLLTALSHIAHIFRSVDLRRIRAPVGGRGRAGGGAPRALHASAQQSVSPGGADARRRYVCGADLDASLLLSFVLHMFSIGFSLPSVRSFNLPIPFPDVPFLRSLHYVSRWTLSSPSLALWHAQLPEYSPFLLTAAPRNPLRSRAHRHSGQRARRTRQHTAARRVSDQQQEDGQTVSALGRRTQLAERAGSGAEGARAHAFAVMRSIVYTTEIITIAGIEK